MRALRRLAQPRPQPAPPPTATPQVDYWVDYVCANCVMGAGLEAVLVAISDYLAFRSFLVGHSATLADYALWGQLQGGW